MKKKGFTLIELLAVIVILAIIALIATPMIMDVIENARKGAAIQSVNGLLEAGKQYQVESMMDGARETEIDLTSDILSIKGSKPDSGELIYDSLGNMSIIAKYGKYCIEKKFLDEEPTIVTREECEMKASEKENVKTKIYGIKRDINTSETTWVRTDDSINLEANAIKSESELETGVRNDFDEIYPWSDIETYTYDVEKKEVTSWYNDNPEGFKFDGSKGEVLTYIPTFYYKRYQEDGYEYILISNKNLEGYTRSDEFSIGRYTMSGDSNAVHSKSGEQPLVKTTSIEFRDYARKLGSEFSQLDYHYFIIQLLYLVEYADYDAQENLGRGNVANSAAISSGECDKLGMKSGTLGNDGKHSMIYRGMEDIYGNIFQFIDGINVKDHQAYYICYNPSQYAVDTFDGCYQKLGYALPISTTRSWLIKLGYDSSNSLIGLPIEVGLEDKVDWSHVKMYITDYCDTRLDNTSGIIEYGGGYGWTEWQSGFWYYRVNHSNNHANSNDVGSRLIKYK